MCKACDTRKLCVPQFASHRSSDDVSLLALRSTFLVSRYSNEITMKRILVIAGTDSSGGA